MSEEQRMVSVGAQQRSRPPEFSWQDINDPGAYVDIESGELYRIPKEALLAGASPLIRKESTAPSRLVQISKNPFVTNLEARLACCEHSIKPNF
jgi:hypothetical protein